MHWIRPYFLILLIPALLLLLANIWRKSSANTWANICDAHLLPRITVRLGDTSSQLHVLWLALIWTIAIIALAGPSFHKVELPFYKNSHPVVILMDLSANMLATDVKPNRLKRARYKLRDLLQALPNHPVALVAFAGEPFLAAPLTTDSRTIQNLLPSLKPSIMPEAGHNTAMALAFARQLLSEAGKKEGSVILLTSGSDASDAITRAAMLKSQGYKLHVLGIGTQEGSPIKTAYGFAKNDAGQIIVTKLDESRLKGIAQAGDGTYRTYTADNSDIESILSLIDTEATYIADQHTRQTVFWDDAGYYGVFVIMLLLLPIFRRTRMTRKPS